MSNQCVAAPNKSFAKAATFETSLSKLKNSGNKSPQGRRS